VDSPLTLTPAPEMLTLEIVTLEFPVFVKIDVRRLLANRVTFPKFKPAGLAVSKRVATLTVKVALLLVALPAEFLTATAKLAPLSAVVVAGVV
jgi:hypothetical protein